MWTPRLLLAGMLVSLPAIASELPLVGIDEDGTPIEVMVERATFSERMEKMIAETTEATTPALESMSESGKWKMHTVVVGIGVNFEIGLGEILSLGITPRVRFAFSKHQDPIVP